VDDDDKLALRDNERADDGAEIRRIPAALALVFRVVDVDDDDADSDPVVAVDAACRLTCFFADRYDSSNVCGMVHIID
jgi:hypothetical protein